MDTNDSNRITLLGETDKYCSSITKMGHEASETPPQKQKLRRNIFVDILSILFGISSWIGVTSTFLQLPLLISSAPEGWKLASYIVITVQMANIGSLAYVMYQKYSPKKIDDGLLIYITLSIGCVSAICMAFFYEHTIEINGNPHSVALLIFTLMFALVGCLSSVLFMPYMGRFRECYLVSYMLGMGLNGFISSILALIQGAGGPPECIKNNSTKEPEYIAFYSPPLFSTELYFEFVFGILVLSTIAFVLLNTLKTCKNEYAAGTIGVGNEYHYDNRDNMDERNQMIPKDVLNLSTYNYIFLMGAVVGLSGLGNGVLPGLIIYSCAPYGNSIYHFAMTLAFFANPCAGFLAMLLPHNSIRIIRFLCFIGSILAVYIFYIALQSPAPPLKDEILGKILIIVAWTVFTCIINYMKISIVSIFRYQEGRSLVWVGTVNQISSAVGAIISFILVNNTKLFVPMEPC